MKIKVEVIKNYNVAFYRIRIREGLFLESPIIDNIKFTKKSHPRIYFFNHQIFFSVVFSATIPVVPYSVLHFFIEAETLRELYRWDERVNDWIGIYDYYYNYSFFENPDL